MGIDGDGSFVRWDCFCPLPLAGEHLAPISPSCDKARIQLDALAEVDGDHVPLRWAGRYLLLDKLKPGSEVEITFPITQEKVTYTYLGSPYAFEFRGDTVVSLSPGVVEPGYPTYLRDHYKTDQAPIKEKKRYVDARLIRWQAGVSKEATGKRLSAAGLNRPTLLGDRGKCRWHWQSCLWAVAKVVQERKMGTATIRSPSWPSKQST